MAAPELILKQSPLIEVFRQAHTVIQNNFHLLHHSVHHAPPDIQKTLNILCELLEKHSMYKFKPRQVACSLKDHFHNRMRVLQMEKMTKSYIGDKDNSIEVQPEDLEVE